jgi:CheY-like chemotaxis protein
MMGAFAAASASNRAWPGQAAARSAPVPGRAPRRVLVVDDERDLADLAEALLCSSGLEVKVAYCGADALLILAGDPAIDAVFSDVMMPGMTGLQLADAIRLLYPSVKVVLTTGFALPALMANHGQPYPCAAKPYRIETVLELLRS